jgi:transcriptional regulator GlxA family with amidase domain
LLGELYESNQALSLYSQMSTRLLVLTASGAPVTLAGGRVLAADGPLCATGGASLVYLPDFEVVRADEAEAAVAGNDPLWSWLAEQKAAGSLLAASGMGVWHLAKAGLLDGERAAVEPRLAQGFRRAFPRLAVELVMPTCTAGRVMTCASAAAEHEFVVRALERAISRGVGEWLAMRWSLDVEGPSDPLVARAQLWIRERFTGAFRIQDLAAVLSVSHQTLIRHFRLAAGVTPRQYAQGLRIQAARMMLRDTPRSVAEIAALVGYSDLPTFRAIFLSVVGQTPAAFRRTSRAGS